MLASVFWPAGQSKFSWSRDRKGDFCVKMAVCAVFFSRPVTERASDPLIPEGGAFVLARFKDKSKNFKNAILTK